MVTFSDNDEVFSSAGSSYVPSRSSNRSFRSANTSLSSVDSYTSAYSHKPSNSINGASLSVNDRFPILTATSQNLESKLQNVPQLFSSPSSKVSLLKSWMNGIPEGATETGHVTPESFATGLHCLDRQYAASSVKPDIDAWSDALSSVGNDITDDTEDAEGADSGRSVVGDEITFGDKGTPYQGGFIGSKADCWRGMNGLRTDGRSIPRLDSTTKKSFVPFDGGYVEDHSDSEDESTVEDYHQVVKSGYRTRDDSRPPRSTAARTVATNKSSVVSNLPNWKNYTSVSDVDSPPPMRTQTANKSTFHPRSILKKAPSSYIDNSAPSRRPPQSSLFSQSNIAFNPNISSKPQPKSYIEEWQIRSDMKSFERNISYWHSKAEVAESKGDLQNSTIYTGIGDAYARKWRGANRHLEQISGKSITVYDYKSELSLNTNTNITNGDIEAEEFMLDLEKRSAMRWSSNADEYASVGDLHMETYCQSQSRAATWKAEELERELNVKKAVLNSRRGTSFGTYGGTHNVVYSTYMPGSQGFLY